MRTEIGPYFKNDILNSLLEIIPVKQNQREALKKPKHRKFFHI
jgi:hypothetical protein